MDNPLPNYFPARLLCFENEGEADQTHEDTWTQVEVVDHGNGFVEIAWNDRNERAYLAFRVSDLIRAIKESANG